MPALPAFPEIANRYVFEERIGSGGLGEVFRARDLRLGRHVAIKWLKPGGDDEHWRTQSALHEAKHLASFQHPNIVTVHDLILTPKGVLVIMEFLNGKTLEDLAKDNPLTIEDFALVTVQALQAIVSAHAIKMIHRDIKPANIMLVEVPGAKFYIKILDFGMAKIVEKPVAQTIIHGGTHMLGSIYTMSPEQFERQPVDERVDLYALGCTLYFVLTCRHPFDGPSIPAVINAHLQHLVAPIQEARPDCPSAVCEWLMRMISAAPADRPKTAAIALKEFQAAIDTPALPAMKPDKNGTQFVKLATSTASFTREFIEQSRKLLDKTLEAIKKL